jgi:diguanylate cyclase (GGDEF)-like protein/PAS domain S-box-containing protein
MSNPTIDSAGSAEAPWWLRAHRALMPDYNRTAAVYWWLVVAAGAAALAWAAASVAARGASVGVQVVVGCAIAMFAGLFPVRVPGSKNSFAAGEIFIFLLLLMHGPSAAALAAAGEGFIGSMRTSKRWTSRLISPAIAALSITLVGGALHQSLAGLQQRGWFSPAALLLAAALFALAYFIVSTALITAVPYLKRRQAPSLHEMFGSFGWVGVTYASSALIAGLLHLTFQEVGLGVLAAAVPIIAMLLTMLHYHFRQREADEAAQHLRMEAAERMAEQSARHVQELRRSEQRFHAAFSNASIGMALVSTDGGVLQVNRALCQLLGRTEQQMLGTPIEGCVEAEDLMRQLQCDGVGDDAPAVELRCRHPQGLEVWVSMHAGSFAEPSANAPCLILQVQDITARRLAESRLQHIAYHDGLTALANRSRFREHLAEAIARHRADPAQGFALMYLDFDRFKLINDTLGHSAGDVFLVAVARRIQHQVRPCDIVGRLGGDEFAVLVPGLDDPAQALAMAERLLDGLRQPYNLNGNEVNSSASIGITFASIGYDSPDEVLRDADIAMYRAKSEGRARCALFDAALRAQIEDQVQLEAELRVAIEQDQIGLAYQPLYDLAEGSIVGFEALARWNHPQRGPIGPDRFIPIAEESGLIGALTDRVLSRACRQLKVWQTGYPKGRLLTMNVNLSGITLCHEALAHQVTRTLLDNGLLASQLTLEITETMLMSKLEAALGTMTRLREIGAGFSVDDFGTGYSSLSYLSTLPITSLKIDRSFVARLGTGAQDVEVVKAIITLGHALGKMVVAEGVETAEQLHQLRLLGCRYGQGYLFSRPLPADQAELLIRRARPPAELLCPPVPPVARSARMALH